MKKQENKTATGMGRKVNSVGKAIDILNCFNETNYELSLAQFERILNIPKSTLHGIIRTLESESYIYKVKNTQNYRLGLKCMQLGYQVHESLPIIQYALPYITELQRKTGQNIYLTTHRNGQLFYLECAYQTRLAIKYSVSGKILPLHCTGAGKAMLSYMCEEEVERIVDKWGLISMTANTITDLERLRKELKIAREQGYALDNEEETLGVNCVGVAIRDSGGRPVGALSISCPSIEIGETEILKYVSLLNLTSLTFAQSKWNDFFPVQFL